MIVLESVPTRRMLAQLWSWRRSFAAALVVLYAVRVLVALSLAIGSAYAGVLLEKESVLAGVAVALAGVAVTGVVWRSSRAPMRDVLTALSDWAKRVHDATERNRASQRERLREIRERQAEPPVQGEG